MYDSSWFIARFDYVMDSETIPKLGFSVTLEGIKEFFNFRRFFKLEKSYMDNLL